MLFSPTIGAAIAAGFWSLWVRCPACRTINAIRLSGTSIADEMREEHRRRVGESQ
jgi:phage FluMu protein Com